ncbi:hypothetical protein [Synechococcus elongatus]|uniref:hypothetical protein n=1 Tax=Synechococcus elongatus TaxID=32046 RepID=UPI0013750865|nr:hypothetical protein [Synechococcus elongatus]
MDPKCCDRSIDRLSLDSHPEVRLLHLIEVDKPCQDNRPGVKQSGINIHECPE